MICGGAEHCRLLLQVTNEIISLCFRSISLDQIFQGCVTSSKKNLRECIECCMSWKKTYLHTSQIHRKYERGRGLLPWLPPSDWSAPSQPLPSLSRHQVLAPRLDPG